MWLLILLPLDSKTALSLTLFAILVLSGVGLPVPEEITLLLGGYLAYLEFLSFWPTVYILISGILTADIVGYAFGRLSGELIIGKISHRKYAARFLERARYYFNQHGEKVVIFSRLLVGVRVVVPILAGQFRMNLLKFLIYDSLATIPWTFFWVFLSYYLGSGLELISEVRELKHTVFILIGVAIVLYAAVKFLKIIDTESLRYPK